MDKKSIRSVDEVLAEEEETSPTKQLEKLRQKTKMSEDERAAIIEEESGDKGLFLKDEDDDTVITDESSNEEAIKNLPADISFTPDKYLMETVQKIAKNVKYESYLIKLLKEGDITRDSFLSLFNSMSDETLKLIQRRAEIISEIEDKIKKYRSTVEAAQQGMKLLDLRRSIEDASEEEYTVKAAALNWDIDHYQGRIGEEKQKATYLKDLGTLIKPNDLEKLINGIDNSVEAISKLNVNDETKGKIKNSMQQVLSLLKETSGPKEP